MNAEQLISSYLGESSTLMNRYKILKRTVRRKSSGTNIHKANNMLTVAYFHADAGDTKKYDQAEREILDFIFNGVRPKTLSKNGRPGRYGECISL